MKSAFNAVMRVVSSVLGLLMIFMGSVWMMQGLNIGPQAILRGFMVSNLHWTFYGALVVIIGVCQVVWSNTRPASS